MKNTYLLSLLLLLSFSLSAQDLLTSRKSSLKTYIFKISNQEAEEIYTGGRTTFEISEKYYHTLVDSFLTDSTYKKQLAYGHYLDAHASENELITTIFTISPFEVFVLNNQTDLMIQVRDAAGNYVENAKVKLDRRTIKLNQETQSYRIGKSNQDGWLKVEVNGLVTFQRLKKEYKNSRAKRIYSKVLYSKPIRWIWRPVRFWAGLPVDGVRSIIKGHKVGSIYKATTFPRKTKDWAVRSAQKIACVFGGGNYYCDDKGSKYQSIYFATNKPKYFLKDTVFFKAFIVKTKNKKPIDDELEVFFRNDAGTQISLGKIQPEHEGAYSFDFVLNDSLKLKLDKSYSLYLKDKKQNTIASTYIKVEDYELGKTKFEFRVTDNQQFANDTFKIFAKGTDENDLQLPDARIELTLLTKKISKYFPTQIFILNTLWTHSQPLKADGETEIVLPDSLFPNAEFSYQIIAEMRTSDNERIEKKEIISYFQSKQEFELELVGDSLKIDYFKNAENSQISGTAEVFDAFNNSMGKQNVNFPITLPFNHYAYRLLVVAENGFRKWLNLGNESSGLQCFANRTADTVNIQVQNPHKIPFVYQIYKQSNLIEKGNGLTLNWKEATSSKKNYYVAIQYLWAGKVKELNYEISLKDKQLKISVEQPSLVVPGQEVEMEVSVKNHKEKPVENVDLLAYSLTSKFDYSAPNLPYLGKSRKARKAFNKFSLSKKYREMDLRNIALNYSKWNPLANLDSLEYYKLTYSKNNYYQLNYTSPDSLTQFAPFVVNNGEIQAIHSIEIDNLPIYFRWTISKNQPFSFLVDSGFHHVKLRTSTHELQLDSVYFGIGEKQIFSVDISLFQVSKLEKTKTLPKNENAQIWRLEPVSGKVEEKRFKPGKGYRWYTILNSVSTNGTQTLFSKPANIQISKIGNIPTKEEKRKWNLYTAGYRNPHGSHFSALKQGKRFFPLIGGSGLIGPLVRDSVHFSLLDSFQTSFVHEPSFQYEFYPNILKMRTLTDNNAFGYKLNQQKWKGSFSDLALTENKYQTNWEEYLLRLRRSRRRYYNPTYTSGNHTNLRIDFEVKEADYYPLNIILIKSDDLELIRVYEGGSRIFHQLEEGKYNLLFLLPDGKYFEQNSIQVFKNGKNLLRVSKPDSLQSNEFGNEIFKKLNEQFKFDGVSYSYRDSYAKYDENNIKQEIKKSYIVRNQNYNPNAPYIIGTIKDNTGEALPGATVTIKGTTYGSVTDIDGNYSVRASSNDVLVFSFVGMNSTEVSVGSRSVIDATLSSSTLLEEIVVTGYGMMKTGSVDRAISTISSNEMSLLQGRVSGVDITGNPGLSPQIFIRGNSTISGENQPLYVIDGVPYTGDLTQIRIAGKKVSPDMIESMQVLKGAAAMALYGARGVNGVILITSKGNILRTEIAKIIGEENPIFKDIAQGSKGSSLRSNFSDYAFWKPNLRTNSEGKASFKVKFPDDITKWETFVLGVNGNRQTGQAQGEIKSFKPLMAQLAVPRFLLAGDSAFAIGKTLNYSADSVEVKQTFAVNDKTIWQKNIQLERSVIDTLLLTTSTTDSLSVKYTMEKVATNGKGYLDGELRKIPVFPVGFQRAVGDFFTLDVDTSFTIQPETKTKKLIIRAETNQLDIALAEVARLRKYKYYCNEQLASKLKGLLVEQKIAKFLGKEEDKKYNRRKEIEKILEKLEKRQKTDGTWGWWENSSSSYWISSHVTEAFLQAEIAGFPTKMNKQRLINSLVWQLENRSGYNKLHKLHILEMLDAKVDYKKHLAGLDTTETSMLQKYQILELKQKLKLPYQTDSLKAQMKNTLFGNLYWSEKRKDSRYYYHVYENPILTTLQAYKVLRNDSVDSRTLTKIRQYFMENRTNGYWRNTYESAQILEIIVPDWLTKGESMKDLEKAKISLKGMLSEDIYQFPYQIELDLDSLKQTNNSKIQPLEITKTGDFPVYFTAYEQIWETETDTTNSEYFVVNSYFGSSPSSQSNQNLKLEAGEKITLTAKVVVKKKADYVMVEIPIPASCSYASKKKGSYLEAHREYARNKVSIFCETLKAGIYQFKVELLPRYSGSYTLNPATAEQMYFPVFYGNEKLKRVSVE
jgi:TonB-dependent SusC/RagA subfamily outer membrane receptor